MATIIRVPINLRTMHRFSKRRNRWFTKIALRSPLPLSNPPLSSARSIFIELPPYSYSVRTVQLESLSLHLRFHFIVIKGTTDRKATLSFYIFFLAFTSKPTTSRLILVSSLLDILLSSSNTPMITNTIFVLDSFKELLRY